MELVDVGPTISLTVDDVYEVMDEVIGLNPCHLTFMVFLNKNVQLILKLIIFKTTARGRFTC